MKPRRVFTGVLALVLWIATCALGLLEVYLVLQMVGRIYARFGSSYWSGVTIDNATLLILALLYIAFAVGTGEYHQKRVGQRNSWRLFGWTMGIQVVILVLCYLV